MPPFANDFVEDSALLVATAYLFLRGPIARLMLIPAISGIVVGLLGSTEAVLPGLRFPYAVHSLACLLAAAVGGWRSGLVAIAVIGAVAFATTPSMSWLLIRQAAVATSVGLLAYGRRPTSIPSTIWLGICALIAQSSALLVGTLGKSDNQSIVSAWTIPANALGAFLIGLVIQDARDRDLSESRRVEVEVMKRLEAEARFTALQARLRPHFLSNALTCVAELCHIDSSRASNLVVRLAKSLRRHIDLDVGQRVSLADEIAASVEYLEIEKERFGPRLRFRLDVQHCQPRLLPAFSVQTLVENAVTHGISGTDDGEIVIGARNLRSGILVFVADDGPGFPTEGWRRTEAHGMGLVDQQLRHLFGDKSRIRTFTRPGNGSLVVFRVPRQS